MLESFPYETMTDNPLDESVIMAVRTGIKAPPTSEGGCAVGVGNMPRIDLIFCGLVLALPTAILITGLGCLLPWTRRKGARGNPAARCHRYAEGDAGLCVRCCGP